ncbi:MAG: hypothetical protein ABIR17_11600 [Pseudolysinimonas sp.]|uniref:hypothetical protein n=1 Tax=Pseudolysinimonas sp. TaxID=2680009 RepID=UPI003264F9DB
MADDLQKRTDDRMHPAVMRSFDKVLSVQRPVVLAHIRSIRTSRPNATPAQIIAILERRYLTAVTTGGALVGASAAIPAVGVGASLVLSGVETAGFLEASALFAQSVTELHGIAVDDPERARTLVMTMMLGNGGRELLTQFAGQAVGRGTSRNVYWGELVTKSMPRAVLGPIAEQIQKTFLKKFAVSQGGSVVGRMIPFGIGAVVGGSGNHLLGRRVVNSARTAFPPAPETFPLTLDAGPKAVKVPKAPKAVKEPKAAKALKPARAPKTPKPRNVEKLPRGRANYPMLPSSPPPPPSGDRRDGPPPTG